MSSDTESFIRRMKKPLAFRFFLFSKLPAAFIAGVKLREIDSRQCLVSIPYKWLSQNPFRSTYFACLSMAAEMSTGALAMAHLYKKQPAVSMLVVKVESEYFKKAVGRTYFRCEDGGLFENAIREAIETGEPRIVSARSVGRNNAGDIIAEFFVTWSFKVKKQRT